MTLISFLQLPDVYKRQQRWEKKIEDGRERIREEEIVLKKLEEQLELRRDTLKEKRENLEEQQEILQWEHHEKAKEKIGLEEYEERDEIAEHLQIWKNQLTTGRTALSLSLIHISKLTYTIWETGTPFSIRDWIF